MNNLPDKRIIITGCGYKPAEHIFHDLITGKPTHTELFIDGQKCKANVGSGIALALVKAGAVVHMVSRHEEKLAKLKQAIVNETHCHENQVEYSAVDLLGQDSVTEFVSTLPKDKPLYWVNTIGLGAGSYKVKDDNPYLPLEEIDIELIEAESRTVIRGTHLLMKALLPILKKQPESRIAIITSMSATRGYDYGGTHCTAKGAIDRYTNSAMLALAKNNIFVTAVRPGAVDTGLYDKQSVIDAVKHIFKEYNYDIEGNNLPLIPPLSVGEVISEILSAQAHITSINLAALKQFPNEAS